MSPYNDSGYQVSTVQEIIREKEQTYRNLMDVINNSVSDIQWQWMKTSINERREIEILNSVAAEQMAISTAVGAFLNRHGENMGITRKGATRAEGYVEVTKNINGVSFTIPQNTRFTSSTTTYISSQDTIIPYTTIITKTKTGESDDYFSSEVATVTTIEEIRDSNNNIIPSSYYVLDPIYLNNIQWTEASSAVLIANEEYTVKLSGSVTVRVEVASLARGTNTYATIGTVTACVQFPALSVTNEEEISGGMDQEADGSYRTRLLQAVSRTFTLGNIKTITLGLEGVRAAKVYQNTGIDQASVDDWVNPVLGTSLDVRRVYPSYSQAFVPGDQIATLGIITLRGRPVNDPSAIGVGIKRDVDDNGTGDYFDFTYIEEYETDQSQTGMRDLIFHIKHNDMDKTKTYRFDVFCKDPENTSFDWNTNHWLIETTTEGYRNDSRGMLYSFTGNRDTGSGSFVPMGNGIDLMFKSHFNGAGFSVIMAPEDGYGFVNLKATLENYFDYVGRTAKAGLSPICIQSTILEADEVLVDIKGVIYITALADFQNVRRELNDSIEIYLESLDVGDNVVYSRIYHIIMDHAQVYKLENLYIKRNNETEWTQRDVGIIETEIPDIGTVSFQRG